MSPRGWQLLGLRNVIGQPKELRTESIMAGQLSEEVHPYAVRTNCAPTFHPLLFFNHLKQGERSQIDMMHKSWQMGGHPGAPVHKRNDLTLANC
eukprot:s1669_g4.t1